MDSDESGHSESKFYYPEEETLNQMPPINFFPNNYNILSNLTRDK